MTGQRLGKYEVLDLVGVGGMGAVYRAQDTELDRVVALKVMSSALVANADEIARFKRGAQALARLQHPAIVTIHDYFEARGVFCLVMELVPGEPLEKVIDNRWSIPVEKKLRLMAAVCRALEYAHGKNVVHRDLKPGNVLMLSDYSPKIIDFGIAKLMDGDNGSSVSSRIGSPAYMAPEQFSGKMDNRTDVFAAGILLYELLAGISPFDHADTAVCMRKILVDPTPELPRTLEGLPPTVHGIVATALEKDPAKRFQKAGEMADALDRAIFSSAPEPIWTGRGQTKPDVPPPPPLTPAPPPPPDRQSGKREPTLVEPRDVKPPEVKPPFKPDLPVKGLDSFGKDLEAKPPNNTLLYSLVAVGIVILAVVVYAVGSGSSAPKPTPPTQQTVVAPPAETAQDAYNRGDLAYFQSACSDRHEAAACSDLASLYYKDYTDHGTTGSLDQAKQLYGSACSSGVYEACGSLGSILFGQGGHRKEATTYWLKACENGGVQASCNLLDKMGVSHIDKSGTATPAQQP